MTATAPVARGVPLCDENLALLSPRIRVPSYDRAALSPAVVHMSVGSFHRSHQAVYFDELAELGERDWGIVGVGLRRPRVRAALSPQDGLYTVVARGPRGDSARVIGVMTRYLFAPEDGDAVLEALVDERTALVTLTITAGAYDVGAAAAAAPDAAPESALGYLVAALDRRRRARRGPFTVLSCDNLPGNGAAARTAVVAFAALRDERLAAWIDANVAFPNSMVDRITPQTGIADRESVARDYGVLDRSPVITESFSQWVVEDSFCHLRPPLDRVGVQFVDDVTPYALMKTRLLNASHCAIGFLGSLAGLRRADEVMRDSVLGDYVERLMSKEVAPLLPEVPDVDLDRYVGTLLDRLANPNIGDDLRRLCRAGSTKISSHVLPSIVEARRRGRDHRLLTLAVAGWLLHPQSVDGGGRGDPRPVLAEIPAFGALAADEAFVCALESSVRTLERHGVHGAVADCLAAASIAA